MKKLLSIIVVLALVLSTMSVSVFAATVSDDVTDSVQKAAVDRLSAFGLVNGMEDGKFHPENQLTRAEASKLIVVALGLGSAADAAKGATQFSDVAADHWASGYINVAAGQGIVKGTGNGMFSPEAQVSYAQVITMLVRALGYKDEFLPGTWPGNYVAKAADVNIDDGVKFTPDGIATRGAVAVMVNNTLDADTITVGDYSTTATSMTYNDSHKTLLEDKLGYDKYENVRLVSDMRLSDSYASDEVALQNISGDVMTINDKKVNNNANAKLKFNANTVNPEVLMGEQVKAYCDGDKVVYLENDESGDVVNDYVSYAKTTASAEAVKLRVQDKEYNFGSNAELYINGNLAPSVAAAVNTANDDILEYDTFGKFVIEDNKIVFADAVNPHNADAVNAAMVEKVDTDNGIVTVYEGTDNGVEINLKDDYDKYMIRSTTGAILTLADLKANNVIYLDKVSRDGDNYAMVTVAQDNTLTGSLSTYKGDSLKVDGTSYDLRKYQATLGIDTVDAYMSSDKLADISDYSTSNTDLEDLSGTNVTLVKDAAGYVLYVIGDAKSTSGDMYGVVTKIMNESENVKVYTKLSDGTGDEVTYPVEKYTNDVTNQHINIGSVIKFKINKDGQISDGTLKLIGNTSTGNKDMTKAIIGTADDKTGSDSITVKDTVGGVANGTAKNYTVDSDTVIIDAPNLEDEATTSGFTMDATVATAAAFTTDDLALIKWDDIKEDALSTSARMAIIADDKYAAKAIIFYGVGAGVSTNDEQAAYVVDKYKNGDTWYAQVKFYNGDLKEDLEVDTSVAMSAEEGYVVKMLANGKIKVVSTPTDFTKNDMSSVTMKVYAKSGDYVQFYDYTNNSLYNSGTWYKLSSSSVIYKGDTSKTKSNVTVGTRINDIVVEDGINVRVLEINND